VLGLIFITGVKHLPAL